ncbi:disease resistance protein RPM1 [Vigna unguiculata]|uniref:Disease resistance protein RPM1 n=1 Tax=Vigna unguiculata TaxID=3917 RepID=A0A4D6M5Z1_VIGUN|nr:disease resistance protein RPM1 [Vigna unguiculata]
MAESFLFTIAESLIEKLASHVFQEASRVVGLYDDLQELTKNLSLVKAVLLDAEQKQERNHELREWLTHLKTVFSDAEDVLDEFECQTLRNKVVKVHGSTKDKVSHFFSTSNPLLFRCKMGQQIKDISKRLDKVAADRHKFSLQIIDVDTRVVHPRDMTHSRCLYVNSNIQNIPDNVRHLSFAESSLFNNLVTKKSAALRTVLFPNGAAAANCEALLNTCLPKFKCLRVLDLRGAKFETLPRNIVKLKHLRYLDIGENANIKRLPDSVCKLQSLQVLLLAKCIELEALPKGLRKLISLRCLEFSIKQTVLPMNEIANLGSLEMLNIESCHNVESIFGGVKFPILNTLCVEDCQSLKSLLLDGQNFPQLETLMVANCGNLDLEVWKGHHEEESSKLKLKLLLFFNLSQLVALPKWLQKAANSLQCLTVSNCHNFEILPDWLTTLTHLETLHLSYCPNLVSLPDNIHHLTVLESLIIVGCPYLCKNYEPHVGEFWPKISHIKNVVIKKPEEPEKN